MHAGKQEIGTGLQREYATVLSFYVRALHFKGIRIYKALEAKLVAQHPCSDFMRH